MKTQSFVAVALALTFGCGASAKGLESSINRAQLTADQTTQHQQLVAEGDALWEQRAGCGGLSFCTE